MGVEGWRSGGEAGDELDNREAAAGHALEKGEGEIQEGREEKSEDASGRGESGGGWFARGERGVGKGWNSHGGVGVEG